MDLNNWKTYLAITIVGVTIGVLYGAIQDAWQIAVMIFFITLYLVISLKFLLERRHYKKHNSVLASSQFLILPYIILLVGNYISPYAWSVPIFSIEGSSSTIFVFNLISISLAIPVIILSVFFSRFYSSKWPAMAINRKIKRGRKFPFLFHTVFILTLLISLFINWPMDFVCFIFLILYVIYIFRYFIVVAINKSRREVKVSARRTATRTTSSRSSTTTQRRRQVPTTSRSGQRTVSTRTRSTTTARTANPSAARVAPGIDVSRTATARTTTKTTKTTKTTSTTTVTKSLFPTGTPKKEEMKCIICYMDFDKREIRRIILCPHCKYPAHEDEFLQWFKTSRLCARCAQPISAKYVNNPKYRVTVRIYVEKVIEKL